MVNINACRALHFMKLDGYLWCLHEISHKYKRYKRFDEGQEFQARLQWRLACLLTVSCQGEDKTLMSLQTYLVPATLQDPGWTPSCIA